MKECVRVTIVYRFSPTASPRSVVLAADGSMGFVLDVVVRLLMDLPNIELVRMETTDEVGAVYEVPQS